MSSTHRALFASLLAGLLALFTTPTWAQPAPPPTPTPAPSNPQAPPAPPAAPTAQAAPTTPVPADPTTVTVTAEAVLAFLQRESARGAGACAISTTYRIGARVAIACGPRGVWIAQLQPDGSLTPLAQQHFGTAVVRLFEGGGRLWAELDRGGAVPFDPNAGGTAATTPAYQPPPAPNYLPQRPTLATPTAPIPALPADAEHGSPLARKRKGGFWEFSATARPFLALETLGGGAVFDGSIGYRFDGPLHVWLSLQPFAPAGGPHGPVSPFVALALISYDTRNFELGLGVGGQTVNDTEGDFSVSGRPIGPGTGITIAQFARFGERDLTSVSLRSDIVLFHSKFQLSNIHVRGQLPLRSEDHSVWLIGSLGYGITGYALGEVGLRNQLSGDGGAGTWFIDVTVGGTTLFWEDDSVECDPTLADTCSRDYSGPLLGVGLEHRF